MRVVNISDGSINLIDMIDFLKICQLIILEIGFLKKQSEMEIAMPLKLLSLLSLLTSLKLLTQL